MTPITDEKVQIFKDYMGMTARRLGLEYYATSNNEGEVVCITVTLKKIDNPLQATEYGKAPAL